jgi:hypothetical protein
MCRGERYKYKDEVFRLQYSGTGSVATMYQNKRFVTFKLNELRCLMNMLHLVKVQQDKYILARDDVMAYTVAARGSTVFVEPQPTVCGLIPYYQLFNEVKTLLI